MRVDVIGAGVLGSLVALELIERGNRVTLWDAVPDSPSRAASARAAGMVAPFSELDSIDVRVAELGLRSLAVWAEHLEKHASWRPHYHQRGSWAVAASAEATEWVRLKELALSWFPSQAREEHAGLKGCDPRFSRRLFFPNEAHLNPSLLLQAIHSSLLSLGVDARWNETWTNADSKAADALVDCRGMGSDAPGLRAVRGEVLLLSAPEVDLPCPVRVVHPRYPIYVVPRGEHGYVVGATTIESASTAAITVRSVLELLSTAYAFHPGFSEASVERTWTGLRPAFVDNLPRVEASGVYIRANGLYRHGWTLAPEVARQIAAKLCDKDFETKDAWLWKYF